MDNGVRTKRMFGRGMDTLRQLNASSRGADPVAVNL